MKYFNFKTTLFSLFFVSSFFISCEQPEDDNQVEVETENITSVGRKVKKPRD